ncbi:hypothetical protein [Streptomyces sp. NPDC006645]|uniref:hypothetical protein n=1 Tax=unclassified Streptomyces TaxID=2593676 RepID=UPI0033B3DC3C
MDGWEGTATLEWWANQSTCLGKFAVLATACVTGRDWPCGVILDPPLSDDDRAGFDFLMELDPLFTLRFGEESTLLVNVASGEGACLILTAHEAKASRPVDSGEE